LGREGAQVERHPPPPLPHSAASLYISHRETPLFLVAFVQIICYDQNNPISRDDSEVALVVVESKEDKGKSVPQRGRIERWRWLLWNLK
jgi:hypothetical protein